VARQYTGTAGRIENAQVGVFLAYAAGDGARALIDRELYLPEKWTADRGRCRAAGIGDEVAFATKPKLAQAMLERAVQAGVPFGWFAADETSDAVKLSSCLGKFFLGGGEGGGLVILAAGGQAVPEAAEQAAGQVALGAGVPVAVGAAAVVVGAGAG
jgi:hypothetical protein